MWVLESNGDFLQGKRMWLKPGKRYLFGRVKKDGVQFAIPHKTVSRQHFIIAIADVDDADVGRIYGRSRITIEDQDSKAGTHIDGQLHKGGSVEPKNDVISIRPGTSPDELVIKWVPCVLTFGLTKKELKNGLLKAKQERVKDLDIRAVSDYISGETTHLVAQKRNTPKGLQALIEGKYIVTDAFVDYLIYLSAPTDIGADETFCPLEIDFDANWPDASKYLPPKGKEPTDVGDEAYCPRADRLQVFEKLTFVFFSQSQYDNLLDPITAGHGKALCLTTRPNITTVREATTLVRKAAGSNRHAVIVKLADSHDPDLDLENHIDSIGKEFGQEPASQSELLDTILTNAPTQLRKVWSRSVDSRHGPPAKPGVRPTGETVATNISETNRSNCDQVLPSAINSATRSCAAPMSIPEMHTEDQTEAKALHASLQESSLQDENPRPRKRPRFIPSQRKVGPFDDDFNLNAVVIYEEEDPVPPLTQTDQLGGRNNESDEVNIKNEGNPDVNRASHTSDDVADSDEDDMDQLLPATAAMRKEKRRQEAEAKKLGIHLKSASSPSNAETVPKLKKEVKMLDVREEARALREADDAAYRRDQKDLGMVSEDEHLKGPAKVVKVVGFDLPVRARSPIDASLAQSSGWKPEWEGRKNFKGFRRAREGVNGEQTTRSKIIVPVASTKTKDGIPFQSFRSQAMDNSGKPSRGKLAAKRAETYVNSSQRSSTIYDDSESDNAGHERVNQGTGRLREDTESVLDHPIDVNAQRQTRGVDAPTQSTGTSTGRSTTAPKRPASKLPSGRGAGTKKQKTTTIMVDDSDDRQSSDDSDDDLKFKFGRSKRLRGADN